MLVSACLLGMNCKYSGGNNYNEKVTELIKKYKIIPVCPEQMGGLCTPRPACEIEKNHSVKRIISKDGVDLTESFLHGAEETLKIAKLFNVKIAILKSKSPSCGSKYIYDGTFSGVLVEGTGITAEMLRKNGIKVYDEHDFFIENVDM